MSDPHGQCGGSPHEGRRIITPTAGSPVTPTHESTSKNSDRNVRVNPGKSRSKASDRNLRPTRYRLSPNHRIVVLACSTCGDSRTFGKRYAFGVHELVWLGH